MRLRTHKHKIFERTKSTGDPVAEWSTVALALPPEAMGLTLSTITSEQWQAWVALDVDLEIWSDLGSFAIENLWGMGNDGYCGVPIDPAPAGDWDIAAKVLLTSGSAAPFRFWIVADQSGWGTGRAMLKLERTSGTLQIAASNDVDEDVFVSIALASDTWHDLVLRYSGGELRVYVNHTIVSAVVAKDMAETLIRVDVVISNYNAVEETILGVQEITLSGEFIAVEEFAALASPAAVKLDAGSLTLQDAAKALPVKPREAR